MGDNVMEKRPNIVMRKEHNIVSKTAIATNKILKLEKKFINLISQILSQDKIDFNKLLEETENKQISAETEKFKNELHNNLGNNIVSALDYLDILLGEKKQLFYDMFDDLSTTTSTDGEEVQIDDFKFMRNFSCEDKYVIYQTGKSENIYNYEKNKNYSKTGLSFKDIYTNLNSELKEIFLQSLLTTLEFSLLQYNKTGKTSKIAIALSLLSFLSITTGISQTSIGGNNQGTGLGNDSFYQNTTPNPNTTDYINQNPGDSQIFDINDSIPNQSIIPVDILTDSTLLALQNENKINLSENILTYQDAGEFIGYLNDAIEEKNGLLYLNTLNTTKLEIEKINAEYSLIKDPSFGNVLIKYGEKGNIIFLYNKYNYRDIERTKATDKKATINFIEYQKNIKIEYSDLTTPTKEKEEGLKIKYLEDIINKGNYEEKLKEYIEKYKDIPEESYQYGKEPGNEYGIFEMKKFFNPKNIKGYKFYISRIDNNSGYIYMENETIVERNNIINNPNRLKIDNSNHNINEFKLYYFTIKNGNLSIDNITDDYENLGMIETKDIETIIKQSILSGTTMSAENYDDNTDLYNSIFYADDKKGKTGEYPSDDGISSDKFFQYGNNNIISEYYNEYGIRIVTTNIEGKLTIRYEQSGDMIPYKGNITDIFQGIEKEISQDYLYLLDSNIDTDTSIVYKENNNNNNNILHDKTTIDKKTIKKFKKKGYTIKYSNDNKNMIIYKKENGTTYAKFYYKDGNGEYQEYKGLIGQYENELGNGTTYKTGIIGELFSVNNKDTTTYFELEEFNIDTNNINKFVDENHIPIFTGNEKILTNDINKAINFAYSDKNNSTYKQFNNILVKEDDKGNRTINIISLDKEGDPIILSTFKINHVEKNDDKIIQENETPFSIFNPNQVEEVNKKYNEFKTLILGNKNTGNKIIGKGNTNTFIVTIPVGKNYGMTINPTGYMFHSENFNIDTSNTQLTPEENEYIKQVVSTFNVTNGTTFTVNNTDYVLFEENNFTIKDNSGNTIITVSKKDGNIYIKNKDNELIGTIIQKKEIVNDEKILTEISKIMEKIQNGDIDIQYNKDDDKNKTGFIKKVYGNYTIVIYENGEISIEDNYNNELVTMIKGNNNTIGDYKIDFEDGEANIYDKDGKIIFHYNEIHYNKTKFKEKYIKSVDSTKYNDFSELEQHITLVPDSVINKNKITRMNNSIKAKLTNFVILPNGHLFQLYGKNLINEDMIIGGRFFCDQEQGIVYEFTDKGIVLYIVNADGELSRFNLSNDNENINNYNFRVATFASEQNNLANNLKSTLIKQGYDAFIEKNGGLYQVIINGNNRQKIAENMYYDEDTNQYHLIFYNNGKKNKIGINISKKNK